MPDTAYVAIQPHALGLVCRVTAEKVGAREAQVIEQEVRAAATAAAAPGRKWRIVIDTAEVAVLASMGLGMLVSLHKEAQKEGGRLVVCGVRPEILDVLRITHLEKVLRLQPDVAAAVKALG
jgi:anti-sigma B factor antagonist